MKRALLLLVLLGSGGSLADERVLSYHSDILVRTDGWIEVTETITVRAEGQQIKRGFLRDYPVRYEGRLGNKVNALYDPHSVTRNGQPEALNSEEWGEYIRTYFGRSDHLIESGEHTYVYRYDAGRILGFLDDTDELYWNVTGVKSTFPIDNASAAVAFDFELPAGSLQLEAYTAGFGDDGASYGSEVDSSGRAWFRTTTNLASGGGLTIVVAWPKGFVDEPGKMQKFVWLLNDNLNLLVVLAGLSAMFGYYIQVWSSYGKNPEPGVILTRDEPPEGFSPASLRYIRNMGYDDSAMTAAIVSLAVKGYLRIDTDDDDIYSLNRQEPGDAAPAMATGEQALYEELFRCGSSLPLVGENHERIGWAREAHRRSLKFDYHKRYFKTNGLLNLPAVLIGIVSSLLALRVGPSVAVFLVMASMAATVMIFVIIMKRPTAPGRQQLDHAAGFRKFLEVAENDEMNPGTLPGEATRLFEKYLPFALALDVERQWADRFTRIIGGLNGPNDTEWRPSWYKGSWGSPDPGSKTSSLSSGLGNSISSSLSPPGSSSGSDGVVGGWQQN